MLHQFITANRDEVLVRVAAALSEQEPARSTVELLDHLPNFLDEVVGALQVDAGLPGGSPLPRQSFTAIELADQRHNLDLGIDLLARGFGLLCDAIAGLADEQGHPIAPREFQILNRCIDTGLATSLQAYLERRLDAKERQSAERVGFLAHELRNSLASATMAYAILRSGQVGITSRTGDVLERSLDRLVKLVDHMMITAQVHAAITLDPHRIELDELLVDIGTGSFPERGVVVELDVEPGLAIEADLRLLTSAVINLVQNAVKFSRDGGHVQVRAHTRDDDVVIEVEDECGGLPPGNPYELLDPFIQRARDRRGLGLGLSITREAVEAHHGELTIRDLPGKGCVFSLRWPRTLRPRLAREASPG